MEMEKTSLNNKVAINKNIMDEEINKKFEEQGIKIDAIYKSVEKTRKYFLVVMWVSVIAFVLPLIALAFVIPSFIETYIGGLEGLL